jgi:hypothetical protein
VLVLVEQRVLLVLIQLLRQLQVLVEVAVVEMEMEHLASEVQVVEDNTAPL